MVLTSKFVILNIGHKVTGLIFIIEFKDFTSVIIIVVFSGLVFNILVTELTIH